MKKKVYSETHKKLIDLVTWLPFGYSAEYFYAFMLCILRDRTKAEIFDMYPVDIKEQILSDLEELNRIREERKLKGGAF